MNLGYFDTVRETQRGRNTWVVDAETISRGAGTDPVAGTGPEAAVEARETGWTIGGKGSMSARTWPQNAGSVYTTAWTGSTTAWTGWKNAWTGWKVGRSRQKVTRPWRGVRTVN